MNIHWEDWCWSWNSNTLATWCKELTHLKRPWCWERLRAGGEGDDRGWDCWMASPTQWTLGVGGGQGGLVCCSPWGCKESDMTEWLNWIKLNYLLEFAWTHVHCVGDAFQPSHPLLPPSPPVLNLSQHQGLSQWLGSWVQCFSLFIVHLNHLGSF